MLQNRRTRWAVGAAGLLAFALAGRAPAQDIDFVLTGFGSAGYQARFVSDQDNPNDFAASISPILLFQMNSNVLFESELEFELEGEETDTTLEYAQVEYQGFENVQFIAGKFLLPFGVFAERLHPTWINKMPSMPLLYGHAHGGVAEGALLPVLADAGLMVRYARPAGKIWKFDVTAYVTQGPRIVSADAVEDDHANDAVAVANDLVMADEDHDDGEEHGQGVVGGFDIPAVAFGTSFGDNNSNKMFGARVGVVRGGSFELYLSGLHSMYDDENFLDYYGFNVSAEYRRGPFEFRGEGILLRQEFIQDDAFETLERSGLYAQASRRIGNFEPVLRWSQLFDAEVDGVTAIEGREQLAVGLNYWVTASVPVKVAYEGNQDADDRFLLQWAFGF